MCYKVDSVSKISSREKLTFIRLLFGDFDSNSGGDCHQRGYLSQTNFWEAVLTEGRTHNNSETVYCNGLRDSRRSSSVLCPRHVDSALDDFSWHNQRSERDRYNLQGCDCNTTLRASAHPSFNQPQSWIVLLRSHFCICC